MAATTLALLLKLLRATSQALMPTGSPATSRAVTQVTQAQAGTRAMTRPIRAMDLATRAMVQPIQAQAVDLAIRAMAQAARVMAQAARVTATRGVARATTASKAMAQDLAQVIATLTPYCVLTYLPCFANSLH